MKGKWAWGLLVFIAGYQVVRRLGQRSGATDEEADASLPGDEVIPHPMIETTHAITIQAPPSEVWRWLVQAGYRGAGRAGWYTDAPLIDPLVDAFFRLTTPPDREHADRAWMHSADQILPEFQRPHAVGDVVPDGPPGTAYFVVRAVEPERFLILHSDTHIKLIMPASWQGTRWASLVNSRGTSSCSRSARTAPASFCGLAPASDRPCSGGLLRRCSTCLKRSFPDNFCAASSGVPSARLACPVDQDRDSPGDGGVFVRTCV